ncbi:MAG TPA: S8 family serine peptidase, partial [Bacteroidales bacterium]|nr:S8 family serine peptidase [Bacteroidales bacterium]
MNFVSTILFGLLAISMLSFTQTLSAQREADRLPTELILQLPHGENPSIDSRLYEQISPTLNVYRIHFSEIHQAVKYYEEQVQKENTLALHYNYRVSFRDTVPNDPDFDLQYALQNTLSPEIDVQAADAWDFARGGVTANGDTIVIAVVDDGVDIDHIDLEQNIYSFSGEIANTGLDNDGNGYIDDVNGYNVRDENGEIIAARHGTGVAGIIGARGNNGVLISGVNWDTKILPVSMGTDATVAEVIEAYEYVLQQRRLYNETNGTEGAYVVALNNSFGLEGFTYNSAPYWCDFFDTLGQEGIITVAAAPNRTFNIDEIGDLPTVCPSPFLITVASSNFANEWDASGISTEHVDLTSYGGNILTLGLNNSTAFSQNSTSSASAMVTGLLGLMYSVPCSSFIDSIQKDISAADKVIRPILYEGLIQQSFLQNKTQTGGITNFYETLRPLAQGCDTCAAPKEVSIDFINADEDTILIAPTLLSDSIIWLQRISGSMVWDTIEPIILDSFYLSMGPGCEVLEFAFIPVCDSTMGTRSQIFP